MKKDEFDFLGILAIVIALIAFVQGYMNARDFTPIWSGVVASIVSPFVVVLPATFFSLILSALFGGKGLKTLSWTLSLLLVFYSDLVMQSGGECYRHEVEDRWGNYVCFE
jgi:hypothetical protein